MSLFTRLTAFGTAHSGVLIMSMATGALRAAFLAAARLMLVVHYVV